MYCRSPAQISTRLASCPPTISTGNFAAAAVTTTAQTSRIRRTFHETRIFADFLVLQFAGSAGSANWNLSTRFGRADAYGRMHTGRPRLHGGIWRSFELNRTGILP